MRELLRHPEEVIGWEIWKRSLEPILFVFSFILCWLGNPTFLQLCWGNSQTGEGVREGSQVGLLPLQKDSSDMRCLRRDVTQKNSHRKVQLRGKIRGRKRDNQGFPQGNEQKADFPRARIMSAVLPRTLCRALVLCRQTLSFGTCRKPGIGGLVGVGGGGGRV